MSKDELSADAPSPRLCQVKKRFPEEEYGFNLHAEKGKSQFIGKVDANSPAQVAGLQQGDRIIGVNGVLIASETHKQVVTRIKQNPLETTLLVIDEEGMGWYEQRNIRLTYELPNIINCGQSKASGSAKESHSPSATKSLYVQTPVSHPAPPEYKEAVGAKHNGDDHRPTHPPPPPRDDPSSYKPRPRMSCLLKTHTGDEYGFNLHADRGKGHFVGKVDGDSIAQHSGLEQGQRIVGVNGTLIYPNTPHKDVVSLIRQTEMRTELLLASPEVDEYYRQHNLEFSFSHCERIDDVIANPNRSPAVSNGYHNTPAKQIVVANESPEVLRHDDLVIHHNGGHSPPAKPVELPSPSTESSSSAASTHHNYNDSHQPYDGGHVSVRNGVMTNGSYSSPDSHGSTSRSPELDPIFNLTAAELKEKLALKKKRDPKKEQMSFKQKYEIVKNL